jgi:hypothetical protein
VRGVTRSAAAARRADRKPSCHHDLNEEHTMPSFEAIPEKATVGSRVVLQATGPDVANFDYTWKVPAGSLVPRDGKRARVAWNTTRVKPGAHDITVDFLPTNGGDGGSDGLTYELTKAPYGPGDTVPIRIPGAEGDEAHPFNVSLQRSSVIDTSDQPLWNVIRRSCEQLSFNRYKAFVDYVICDRPQPANLPEALQDTWEAQRDAFRNAAPDAFTGFPDPYPTTRLPFTDVESYRLLKAATEAFMMVNCGVEFTPDQFTGMVLDSNERDRLGLASGDSLARLMREYLLSEDGSLDDDGDGDGDGDGNGRFRETIPYLSLVRRNVPDVPLTLSDGDRAQAELCYRILREKLTNPCFLELIWSYWHEEGMLVQTINAISMRFQNRRGRGDLDPLADLAIDPLRPLGNLIWGWVQDEQHRLSLARRVYEYDHEYGLTLYGRAVPRVRGADTRSRFLEAFHTLLHRASIFYKEDDDTTMIADPFPVLNALRDVHLLLAEGAHNQYGDLPWTARHEMLMQQWLLARPELRDFLPTRVMVAYPEPWMGRVDAMKRMQGWSETSVRYFRDLAVFGEEILLSIRFGNWSTIVNRAQAGNWARYWRQEVQWYIHAYQTVTGVDLSSDMQDVRRAELRPDRYMQPAYHLQRRLIQQQRQIAMQRSGGRRRLRSGGRPIELEQEVGELQEAPGDGRTAS